MSKLELEPIPKLSFLGWCIVAIFVIAFMGVVVKIGWTYPMWFTMPAGR